LSFSGNKGKQPMAARMTAEEADAEALTALHRRLTERTSLLCSPEQLLTQTRNGGERDDRRGHSAHAAAARSNLAESTQPQA
jgi:hypothetical protein